MDPSLQALIDRRANFCFPVGLAAEAREFSSAILGVLFPHFATNLACDSNDVEQEVDGIRARLERFAEVLGSRFPMPEPGTADAFLASLPAVSRVLEEDAQATYHNDPAATSIDEVILTYPGFYAIAVHRVANALLKLGYPVLPRLLSEQAHSRTGIDIHPGASIGRSFFIDHGTGVVIGETTVVGNRVRIYQGVTLGALAVKKEFAQKRRHPTLEDDVVVYANATILGGETVIGHDTIVGASSWITESVPPFSVVGRHSEARPRRDAGFPDLEFYL